MFCMSFEKIQESNCCLYICPASPTTPTWRYIGLYEFQLEGKSKCVKNADSFIFSPFNKGDSVCELFYKEFYLKKSFWVNHLISKSFIPEKMAVGFGADAKASQQ